MTPNQPKRTSRRLLGLFLALGMLAAACGSSTDASPSTDNDSDAAATAELTETDQAGLAERSDKPIVVNFFASWCPSCVAELPDFQEVHEDFIDQVDFVGVANMDRPSDAIALIEQSGVTYDIHSDPNGELFRDFNALGMPTTVFLSTDGEVQRTFSGVLTVEALTDIINEELL